MMLRTFAVAWLALLGCAIALSVLAAQHATLPGDTSIMSWAQERSFPGEALSDVIRAITATEAVLATGGVIAIGLWLLGHRWEAALLAAGLIALPLLQAGIKELADRPRPAEPPVDLRAGFSSESFPAGHVMSPTYLYGTLVFISLRSELPRALRYAAGAWSALVIVLCGPPNVWLGVHWPSDVLGGWAWGLALAGPVALALEATYRRR